MVFLHILIPVLWNIRLHKDLNVFTVNFLSLLSEFDFECYHIYPTPPLGQDMTQGQS